VVCDAGPAVTAFAQRLTEALEAVELDDFINRDPLLPVERGLPVDPDHDENHATYPMRQMLRWSTVSQESSTMQCSPFSSFCSS
jgi:hypothetical protein